MVAALAAGAGLRAGRAVRVSRLTTHSTLQCEMAIKYNLAVSPVSDRAHLSLTCTELSLESADWLGREEQDWSRLVDRSELD